MAANQYWLVRRRAGARRMLTVLCIATTCVGVNRLIAQQRVAAAPDAPDRASPRVTVDADRVPLMQVLQDIAQQARLNPAYDETVIPASRRVTVHVRDMAAEAAFREALRGTNLVAHIQRSGYVSIGRDGAAAVPTAVVTGNVYDAETRRPLSGATVALDGEPRKSTRTDENGKFRLGGVTPGEHRLTVRLLGYGRSVQVVQAAEDQIASVSVALRASTNALDQVIVTGTVVATELKAVPNAMTVITAKQIEERGITRIDQLFRGDVPGLFAVNMGASAEAGRVTMFSRGATALETGRTDNGTDKGTNPIKTYVDGVELADPAYLSQIDPSTIERIEILTGPQASTIYGSNAINGVMQVFTKRGHTNRPQLTLNLQSGLIQNNQSPALTPQHEVRGELTGIDSQLSYSAGASWTYDGPWSPYYQSTQRSAFGGAHLTLPTAAGPVTVDGTFRQGMTQVNRHGGWDVRFGSDVWKPWLIGAQSRRETLKGQMLGVRLTYAPTRWWSHEVGIGQDVDNSVGQSLIPGYFGPSDSTRSLNQTSAEKRSVRYVTTAQVPVTSWSQATVTLGVDSWQSLSATTYIVGQSVTGVLSNGSVYTYMDRKPSHNTGGFVQAQLGLRDQLFLTYGLRAEWNPNFGAEAQPNLAPRLGAAYTQEIGPVTTKWRASYGRSTRPPSELQKQAADPVASNDVAAIARYGLINQRIANPQLGPEDQRGAEGGVELYLGNRASLIVTRFNQTVANLIAPVDGADSVRSLTPIQSYFGLSCAALVAFKAYSLCSSQDAEGYWYRWLSQNMNVASIRNQGWELQGSVITGPLTTRGTYSWTKSRSMGVTPAYAKRASAQPSGMYDKGASFAYVPEHTWALGVTYARRQTTVGLNVTGQGQFNSTGNEFKWEHLDGDIRLDQNRWRIRETRRYVFLSSGYAIADLTASHRFSSSVEGVLGIRNLMNSYASDLDMRTAVIGRQMKAGVRMRFN